MAASARFEEPIELLLVGRVQLDAEDASDALAEFILGDAAVAVRVDRDRGHAIADRGRDGRALAERRVDLLRGG